MSKIERLEDEVRSLSTQELTAFSERTLSSAKRLFVSSESSSAPRHPSLHFKKSGRYFSARVGLSHRVLGVAVEGGVLWFWIGTHADYDKILDRTSCERSFRIKGVWISYNPAHD